MVEGEDDDGGAVSQVELGEDVADVSLAKGRPATERRGREGRPLPMPGWSRVLRFPP
jgi:hypothetical protein